MTLFQNLRLLLASSALATSQLASAATQPSGATALALDDLKPGQRGEVWTVFRGTEPEPFAVEVTGVIRNALGPGKSLIVCELTDERVQKMGAVAGMSGSPLYIDGQLAGALSYQIQRFETVRYAGFTPAADLAEVREKVSAPSPASKSLTTRAPAPSLNTPLSTPTSAGGATPLQPAFTLTGLSPAVAALFAPQFAALGLSATALGGSTQSAAIENPKSKIENSPLRPGSAVAVALATGDITLAGTGTVSRVDGDRVTAFGHPMLSLGEVALPMCTTEIITILPSSMSSVKIANTGAVIGTISQDRLSAVSGTLGPGPTMTQVEVTVAPTDSAPRTLRFSVARQQQLTPMIVAAGVTQAIMGANDAGLANGFRLRGNITFPASPEPAERASPTGAERATQTLATRSLYAGPQGFAQGLNEFVQGLAANLLNPYEKTFPDRVAFTVEPLAANPTVVIEQFQLSRASARPGDTVQATLSWRDFQGASHREIFDLVIHPTWSGKRLEVVLAPGRALDELTGRPRQISASELRSFGAYLAAIGDNRPTDGLCLAIVESAELFSDQTVGTPEAPGSIERIARAADETRFRKRDALIPLWERHVLPGKLTPTAVRRPLRIVE